MHNKYRQINEKQIKGANFNMIMNWNLKNEVLHLTSFTYLCFSHIWNLQPTCSLACHEKHCNNSNIYHMTLSDKWRKIVQLGFHSQESDFPVYQALLLYTKALKFGLPSEGWHHQSQNNNLLICWCTLCCKYDNSIKLHSGTCN